VPEQGVVRGEVVVAFAGDIMLDRDVWLKMKQFGVEYPFKHVGTIVGDPELFVANLEGPVTDRGTHAVPNGSLLFKFDPSTVAPLKTTGIDAVSLANNHTRNQGQAGLDDTRRLLNEATVAHFGDPRLMDAEYVWRTERNGRSFAFVGWNRIEVADDRRDATIDLVRTLDGEVDAVVVLPHWGAEYVAQRQAEVDDARALIDAGADLIIGAHPHVVQGVEVYRDRLIAYSLGNFIFDQYWSTPTQQGLVVAITFDEANVVTAELRPVVVPKAQPRLASDEERSTILERIASMSAPALREQILSGRLTLPAIIE
jgi:poly-gamma-glutamate capsule biosynthesis protein CapA/YwtB (metallophosphatase superfamily)